MKANRTGLLSSSVGAVMVRPTRLPWPLASVKRYQYTFAGFNPPASTRQVQSEASEIGASALATTRVKDSSSAISTCNLSATLLSLGGRRVHKRMLSLSGSPEA